ncbi:DUF4326 domain-containing protein [Streptomyces peucetius]|uniref:DUF4326 domain-containing protein n=1 Tax=Streptomyces peucetius TaxID=1950 RepID=UPI00051804A8|nr:DUF4326 domain-containing protein [Streptomyces peucetius]KOT49946.1 hypothetical protein ADK43_35120 [Streptomyces rimosus subsp. rimosus]
MSPIRIQLRRAEGWRKPTNCVVVSRPSRFGNPFTIKDAIEAEWSHPRRAVAETYSEWLRVGTAGGWYEQTAVCTEGSPAVSRSSSVTTRTPGTPSRCGDCRSRAWS